MLNWQNSIASAEAGDVEKMKEKGGFDMSAMHLTTALLSGVARDKSQ